MLIWYFYSLNEGVQKGCYKSIFWLSFIYLPLSHNDFANFYALQYTRRGIKFIKIE